MAPVERSRSVTPVKDAAGGASGAAAASALPSSSPSQIAKSKPIPPTLLVAYDEATNKFVVTEEGAKLIAAYTEPVRVISIAGAFRTGKSYIMNLLHYHNKGAGPAGIEKFDIGGTVEACTKGIWAWPIPGRKCNGDIPTILLDTEGSSILML